MQVNNQFAAVSNQVKEPSFPSSNRQLDDPSRAFVFAGLRCSRLFAISHRWRLFTPVLTRRVPRLSPRRRLCAPHCSSPSSDRCSQRARRATPSILRLLQDAAMAAASAKGAFGFSSASGIVQHLTSAFRRGFSAATGEGHGLQAFRGRLWIQC